MNMDLALQLAEELARAGVREVCLCAGARNSPLVTVFSEIQGFRLYHFFEERSAAFFALGRIKSRNRPVAVITTSGTAVGELLPATMEAFYTGLPLLLITADRPRRYRGSGAPQAVEQVGIFGSYVRFAADLAASEKVSLEKWNQQGPAQLNLCFEEPLLDRPLTEAEKSRGFLQEARDPGRDAMIPCDEAGFAKLDEFLNRVKRPLVIVGGLEPTLRKSIVSFLSKLGAPVYLEATSGRRECAELEALRIRSTDRLFERLNSFKNPVDGVLRIGGVPTLRFWRDLDGKRSDLPVLSISDCPFPGSARSDLIFTCLDSFFKRYELKKPADTALFSDLFEADAKLCAQLLDLLASEPTSECGMIHALSRLMPLGSRVYLGNSLPIREWDLAAVRKEKGFVFGANRGANGIDGQASTFLGFAEPGQENWALLGDLTAMYDLAAPWILSQIPDLKMKLVVMNNGGGKIFSRMFGNPVFQNQHEVGFAPWAALWKLGYECWSRIPESFEGKGDCLIELRPDPVATARFWEAYDRLCRL